MRYFLLLILITVFPLSMHSIDNVNLNYLQTCIKKHCFLSRIADTPTARAKGLMGETYLPRNEAMLFVFPIEGLPSFWMKKTKSHWTSYLLMIKTLLFIQLKTLNLVTATTAQYTKPLDEHPKCLKSMVAWPMNLASALAMPLVIL